MSDGSDEAVAEFLEAAENVYEEYDQGYMNADVALSQLRSRVETLREATEE